MANYLSFGGTELDCAFARDITERKRLEQELLRSQKLEAIGTLAGGIAHDFNNLLQGIFGYISLAKMTIADKQRTQTMLEQAEQALHMSVNLTTQLLTFAKGGKPLKTTVHLQPLIENAARFALSGSRADYSIRSYHDLWAAEVDKGQFGQVIQNIVLNAEQAMPDGGTIEITARNVRAPKKELPSLPKGRYVEIAVRDTGIGIPANYLRKIFDPYFTTKEKGSGLGLATSYSIVKNHGGLIDVVSAPGTGTTFFIYLPAIEAEREVDEVLSVSACIRNAKILIMDDEELVRNTACALIRSLGHEADVAVDGESAVSKYQAARESGSPFDIVILDLTVRGGMGGREAIERLRVIDPGVRAIVSSGYSDSDVIAAYQKYGFMACLAKPYDVENLRKALNTLLRNE
jgi:nitrogen-specific signal transduction histidine kinase/ActR/RegA family two-component response regulator